LFEEGTHPKLVQELLGHSSIVVTLNRYNHLINPMNTVVADTLDDAVSTAYTITFNRIIGIKGL